MDLCTHENTASLIAAAHSDWIKRAVHLRRHTPQKPTVPSWIANPTPAYQPTPTQRTTLSVLISRRWRDHWRKRDWENVAEFFKAVAQDECPAHDIIRIGNPNL